MDTDALHVHSSAAHKNNDGHEMGYFSRGITAKQLAHDYGMTLNDFTSKVDGLLRQLTDRDASMPATERSREVCVAVWAAITAAFDASALSPEEKDKLAPLLRDVLIPYWQKHCAREEQMAVLLAQHAMPYLDGRDPRSQVATASGIVRRLLERIGASEEARLKLTRQLVPLFAHRMLGGIQYINDAKLRLGLQLSLMVSVAFAGISRLS